MIPTAMLRTVASTYVRAFSGLPPVVWRLCLVTMLCRAGTMVVPFLTLYLTSERGMGVAAAGAFLSIWGAGSIVGSWLGGQVTDALGPMKVQWASVLAGGLGLIVVERISHPVAFGAVLFATGVLVESFRPANMTAIARSVGPGSRAKAFALLRLAINLGMGVGPAMGGVLASIDYRWLFLGNGLALWIAAPSMLGLREPPQPASAEEDGRPRSPWSDGPFLLLLGWSLALCLAFFQLLSTWPVYLVEHHGVGERAIGGLFAFNCLLVVLFEMVLMQWAEDRDRTRLIAFGALFICAGLSLLPFGTGLAWATLTVVVWSVGEMLALPLLNAVVVEHAPDRGSGRYIGAYTMVFSGAMIVAPVVGSTVYDALGPVPLWTAIGVLGPLLAVSIGPIGRRVRRRAEPRADDPAG
jgi:predicted MFS family arabinose efflux permease